MTVTGRVLLFALGIVVVVPIGIMITLFVPARFPNGTATPVLVTVPTGATPTTIGKQLVGAHVINSPTLFRVAVKVRGGGDQLLAGDYAFPHALSPWSAVGALRSQKYLSNERSVRLQEGWTAEEMAAVLADAGVVPASDFLALVQTPTPALRALVPGIPADATLEGYLFPDTYRFLKHSTADAVAKRFLDTFASKRAKLPTVTGSAVGHSLNDVVILASIVEREVKTPNDRAKVADLFWRRLAAGMPLQSDATVNFATGKSLASPKLEDTQVDSLYNTYLHTGLPPGPIGNPGLATLTAALNPTPNDYLYFLTKKDDDTTVFSKTYEEHLANKAKYLK